MLKKRVELQSDWSAELACDWFLGLGLRGARVSADVGWREAGEITGLDLGTIVRIENDAITPSLETLMTLVKRYRAVVEVNPDGTLVTWMGGEAQSGNEMRRWVGPNEMPWWVGPRNRDSWPR
jgi:DNA-binding XRE family transcriptional regulator